MAEEDMEGIVATQVATQPAATGEQSQAQAANPHLWGTLLPTSPALKRLDFWQAQSTYKIGRHSNCDFQLSSPKISNVHCSLTWRGLETGGDPSEVVVEDLSTNGTFINGVRIGKGNRHLLEQGNELTLGAAGDSAAEDHRYIYRHLGNPNPASSIFDKYQLSSELGRGAFASVRRAIGIQDGVTYAVKVIQQRRLGTTSMHERMFAREIEILRSLDHPNIVRCHGVFTDPTTIYIVMEYVSGGDLLDVVIKSGSGLEEQEAKGLTRDICVAMEYLHEHAIVHRDLKPENVLITSDNPRRAKIADFGLAKIIDSATLLRTQCGTPAYLAPEVVLLGQGQAPGYTPAVDTWSVGVMVFSMLTMSMPFGEEEEEQDIRVRMANRVLHWELVQDKSPDAQDWLHRMLTRDPMLRMTMHEALNHRWLLDPYGDYSFAVPGSATPRSATPTGGAGRGGAYGRFGGARNGNTPPGHGGLQGGGAGGTGMQESSSEFIYGAAAEQENRAPVEAGVSSLGLGRMALDSVVVPAAPAKPARAPVAKLGRKRPATTSMEQVVQSPVKKRAGAAHV